MGTEQPWIKEPQLTSTSGHFVWPSVRWRYRVNVAFTSKGMPSFDVTAEGEGASKEEVVAESDALVAMMRERYPFGEAVL